MIFNSINIVWMLRVNQSLGREMCLITLGGSNWVQLGDRNHTVT